MRKHVILLTNDDGIEAEGMQWLRKAVCPVGDVVIVAPDRQRSAVGHSITLGKALRVSEQRQIDGCRAFSCSGTPTDCVTVAVFGLLDKRPDFLISGINPGGNMGEDLTYSGTACAAMEGAILGIPSVALSVCPDPETGAVRYEPASRVIRGLTRLVLRQGMPKGVFLNVNVPSLSPEQIKGISITRLGFRNYALELERSTGPAGDSYYTIAGAPIDDPAQPDTDVGAIAEGRISISPVTFDITASSSLAALAGWNTRAILDGLAD